jgi:hypothetical protein
MPKRSSKLLLPSPERLRRGEPLWRRVVFQRMVRAQTIAVALAGVFGAMMLGISLGNSALSQINPIHFQGAAIHPRDRGAAIDPNRPTVIPNSYEQLYGWSQGAHARAVECPGCTFDLPSALPAEVQVASVSYFGSREEQAQREARERREIDAAYERDLAEAERRSEDMRRLARYADYRVSEDEVVRDPPLERARPEPRERPYYARNDVVLSDEDEGGDPGADQE